MSTYDKLMKRADGLARGGRAEEAISAYEEAIGEAPDRVSAYYHLALLYHRQGEPDEAIAHFEKAADLDPGGASIFNNLGVLYYSKGMWEQAEARFKKALELQPDYAEARDGLETVYQKQGKTGEVKKLNQYKKKRPSSGATCLPPSTCESVYRSFLFSDEKDALPPMIHFLCEEQWDAASAQLQKEHPHDRIGSLLNGLESVKKEPSTEKVLKLGIAFNLCDFYREAFLVFCKASMNSKDSKIIENFKDAVGGEYQEDSVRCDLCGTENEIFQVSALFQRYTGGLINPVRIWRKCGKCGMAYVSPRPSKESLRSYYAKLVEGIKWIEQEVNRSNFLVSMAKERLQVIEGLEPAGKHFLDIGAGIGLFGATARDMGFDPTVLDFNEDVCRFAEERFGLPVIRSDFMDAGLEKYEPDMVTGWEFLEHVLSPLQTMKKVASILTSGGIWAFATPVSTSTLGRMQERRSFWWNEPGHLYYFSDHSLRQMLHKTGFEVVKVRPSSEGSGRMEYYARKV